MSTGLTNDDWLRLLEAVKTVEAKGICRGKWEEIYRVLPQNLKSRTTMDVMRKKWHELSCELKGKRKSKRNVGIISPEFREMMKEKFASTEAAPAAPKAPRKRSQDNEVQLHEVKSRLPCRSSKRGKPAQELELEIVDARKITSDNTDSKEKSWSPSKILFRGTANVWLLLKDVVNKMIDVWDVAPGFTQEIVAGKPNLQNEAGLHEVNKESSNTFIREYEVEANELAQWIGDCGLENCKLIILGKLEELGFQKFNAMLEESSKSDYPMRTIFAPAFSKFRTSILDAMESSTDVLVKDVLNGVMIRNLRD